MDQNLKIQRVISDLVCSSRCPLNGFIDIFFITVLHGEKAFWVAQEFSLQYLEWPVVKCKAKLKTDGFGHNLRLQMLMMQGKLFSICNLLAIASYFHRKIISYFAISFCIVILLLHYFHEHNHRSTTDYNMEKGNIVSQLVIKAQQLTFMAVNYQSIGGNIAWR